jgi:hypothetical protein
MREISGKLNASAKSKFEALRKSQGKELKALRKKHKTEAAAICIEGKTHVQTMMQLMLDK